MKSNKGISMITLIITIICMIIFLGIAYRIGSRYIVKSKEEERTSLVSILSTSVVRRQNDKFVGIGDSDMHYVGYHISSGDFNELYENFEKKDCIYDPGLWFAIDAKEASELGIVDAEKYLISDLKDVSGDTEEKYLAVVDYYTGKVELIKRENLGDIAGDIIAGDDGTNCEHTYTLVSCLEPSVCTKCGLVNIGALGHDYNLEAATCTEDKKCNRCGYIAEKAIGHDYEDILSHNDKGHFNKCKRYDTCGGVGNFKEHELAYDEIPGDEWVHRVSCTFPNCGWVKETAEPCTIKIKSKDTHTHIEYCIKCGKEKETAHDKFKYTYIDKYEHLVSCDSCKHDLYKETHIDVKLPYGICDLCDGIIDITSEPKVEKLVMKNITPEGENEYWAKRNNTIEITLETSLMLSTAPIIELQGVQIKVEDMKQDGLIFTATISTSDYSFIDGLMDIKVKELRSQWGVKGEDKYETTDDRYITYDATKPEYIYIEEN